jgi:competence protein ComEC
MLSTKEQRYAELEYVTEPYLRRESFAVPVWLNGDYCDSNIVVKDGFTEFCGKSVQLLCDGGWEDDSASHPVDILYLCKGFKGKMERLLEKFPAEQVLMDAGLHYMSRQRVARECAALGQPFIDLSQSGAVFFNCREDSLLPHFAVNK